MEILRVPGGYTTNDILSKICKPGEVAAKDYPLLHQLNRESSMLPVLCKSLARLTRLLDYMVERELIHAVDLGTADKSPSALLRTRQEEPASGS